jgi:hypothetical protein
MQAGSSEADAGERVLSISDLLASCPPDFVWEEGSEEGDDAGAALGSVGDGWDGPLHGDLARSPPHAAY